MASKIKCSIIGIVFWPSIISVIFPLYWPGSLWEQVLKWPKRSYNFIYTSLIYWICFNHLLSSPLPLYILFYYFVLYSWFFFIIMAILFIKISPIQVYISLLLVELRLKLIRTRKIAKELIFLSCPIAINKLSCIKPLLEDSIILLRPLIWPQHCF